MGTPSNPLQPGQVPTTVNVGDVASQEIDPKVFSELWHLGADASGRLPKWVVQIIVTLIKCIKLAIGIWVGLIDEFLSILADYFQAAQGNSNPAFYSLVAALITDLTGIEVDGGRLVNTFATRGRLAAMQSIGGSLVDALTSEFTGGYQADRGGVFTASRGGGIGGLPAVNLSPEQGMDAARSFMGFVLSFAVREGNTDFFADSLPFGVGHAFKDITEDMSKNLGLGRMVRLALKPLFQNLISVPMTWAFNKQYRPTLLPPPEAIRANIAKLLADVDVGEELARHGYTQTKADILGALHAKWPNPKELFQAEAGGLQGPDTSNVFLNYQGYTDKGIEILRASHVDELRHHLALRLAETLIHPLLLGEIDMLAYTSVLDKTVLSDVEKQDLEAYANELLLHPRKRLTFAQMTTAFVDGVVAVDQVAEFLHEEGYKEDDISILLQLDLFKLAAAQAAAAAKKAKQKKASGSGTTTPPAGG